jgi:hypothetical protein
MGKSDAERQLDSLLAQQASMETQIALLEGHTSQYQSMLDSVNQDAVDTRSFEEIQAAYLEAQADFNDSSFREDIRYWEAELARMDLLINGNTDIKTSLDAYTVALSGAISGGYADLAGEIESLTEALGIAGGESQASFAGGGTISGPSSGYTLPVTFHGTEHITTDNQMAEVAGLLSDVRAVLVQIRDTAGNINLTTIKSHRIVDRVTGGEDSLQTRAA